MNTSTSFSSLITMKKYFFLSKMSTLWVRKKKNYFTDRATVFFILYCTLTNKWNWFRLIFFVFLWKFEIFATVVLGPFCALSFPWTWCALSIVTFSLHKCSLKKFCNYCFCGDSTTPSNHVLFFWFQSSLTHHEIRIFLSFFFKFFVHLFGILLWSYLFLLFVLLSVTSSNTSTLFVTSSLSFSI